jgi:thiamine biosynthesis lipoprotein
MSNEERGTSNEFKNRNSPWGRRGSHRFHNGNCVPTSSTRLRSLFSSTRYSSLIAYYFLLAVLAALLAVGCDGRREHVITGRTMGTTYSVTVVAGYFGSIAGLQEKIDRRLEEINQSMSPYLNDSEISRFNRFRQTGKEFRVSADFLYVMRAAAQIYKFSDGAWDGTVNPLVDLWGFGRAGSGNKVPPAEKIAALLGDIGFDKIEIRDSGALIKRQASVTLDLSSIAKGFGVDQVAGVVRAAGFTDFIVEIGGEVVASGIRPDGRPWRVGISRPKPEAGLDEIYKVVSLKDRALATSGNYRQFFMQDGRRYSHLIDPRTGYPVADRVVSVSILADTCTLADGLSTAVMVMGAERGLALINRLEGVEGLIVVENPDGSLTDGTSKRWQAYAD